MLILGIDPGTSRIGWSIIDVDGQVFKAVAYGCIESAPKIPLEEKLVTIYQEVQKLIIKYKPDLASLEQIFFASNAKTAIAVGHARGVIVLVSALAQIPVLSYTPLEVKLAICGSGRADKYQVQQMVKRIFRLTSIPKPDDTADALAIALTCAFSYKMKMKNI